MSLSLRRTSGCPLSILLVELSANLTYLLLEPVGPREGPWCTSNLWMS